VLAVAADLLTEVRRAKSEAKRSMRAEVEKVKVTDAPERLGALDKVALDVRSAGAIDQLFFAKGDEPSVEVTLAPEPPTA
jgi:valyl-tRNA synthetase